MIVGLTGGIGSGKSTAARFFTELGIEVVDADQVARDVVLPGTPALKAIQSHFGDDVVEHGQLNRAALRHIVFNDPEAKQWLEALLHPLIRETMLSQLSDAESPYAILEAPLLFENHIDEQCQRSILVDVPEAIQRQRASQRDERSESDIQRIIDLQMPREDKIVRADYLLDNSQSEEELKNQILRLDQVLRLLAANSEFL